MQLYNTLSAEERAELIDQAGQQRLTLSFYAYTKIENPQQFRNELFLAWNPLDALGRTYVAKEGINAQILISDICATNIRLFADVIPVDDHNKMLNQYLIGVDSKYLVFADNANLKLSLPNFPFNGDAFDRGN
jgi:hypothetical protein